MTPLTRIRLKTLAWALLPLALVGIVPWSLHAQLEGAFIWRGSFWSWVGVWLLANGLGLIGWCVYLFNVKGRGTPLPLDPPTQFVAHGPYLVVRNPMALGLFLVLAGQAALYQSRVILCYLAAAALLMHFYVRFVEEPELAHRFGSSYRAYQQQVPRWIPRRISGAKRPKTR